jgi:hypothetical protein
MNPSNESAIKPTKWPAVAIYFTLTYLVSWTGAFLVAGASLWRQRHL